MPLPPPRVLPRLLQVPVAEPFDKDVIDFITVYQGWTELDTLMAHIRDDKPNIEKALSLLQSLASPPTHVPDSASIVLPNPISSTPTYFSPTLLHSLALHYVPCSRPSTNCCCGRSWSTRRWTT